MSNYLILKNFQIYHLNRADIFVLVIRNAQKILYAINVPNRNSKPLIIGSILSTKTATRIKPMPKKNNSKAMNFDTSNI